MFRLLQIQYIGAYYLFFKNFFSSNFSGILVSDAVSCDELKSKLDLESRLSNRKWKICSLREGSQEDADHALQELDTLV